MLKQFFYTYSHIFSILLLFIASCNSLFMDGQKPDTAQNNFDLLWKIIDERYCFFQEKDVDWNKMYDKHCRSQYWDDPTSWRLFDAMAQMLEELRDGHVCLESDEFNNRCYSGWHSGFPDNFDFRRINNNFTIFPESIGYIRCPSFNEKFNRNELDKALAEFTGLKGVIIDVRNNGGGLVSEAYLLASRFAREKTHVGYVRYKIGKGHNDFSDYYARYVEPEGKNPFHGYVVVITNRKVYSAANLFVSMMGCLPQVYIIGDKTGGGGGMPISAELYNGWTVKFSTNPVFDKEKQSIEPGIEPDYQIMLDKDTQKDNIIEAAKTWILTR